MVYRIPLYPFNSVAVFLDLPVRNMDPFLHDIYSVK